MAKASKKSADRLFPLDDQTSTGQGPAAPVSPCLESAPAAAKPGRLRLLHTSDWHLGRPLHGRRRQAEFAAFLDWLAATIEQRNVDVLLVAGDVFDTLTPSAGTQTLYYDFLTRVTAAPSHPRVVIIAGNHDSPALLSAPGELLKSFHIHVVGTIGDDPDREVIVLRDEAGNPLLVVAAVPYPRDRDLRESLPGESAEDKERRLIEAVARHYQEVGTRAREARDSLPARPPLVALGHLFTVGGRVMEGDGVRDVYVGGLGAVPADIFPPLDYLALGHLHQPQMVDGNPRRRYSGAPLALTFAEAGRPKSVTLVDFFRPEESPENPGQTWETAVTSLEVPVFQRLERLSGDWGELASGLDRLLAEGAEAWLEIDHTGAEDPGSLRKRLEDKVSRSGLEILRLKDRRVLERALGRLEASESLAALDAAEVFRRCLAAHQVPEGERPELTAAHDELCRALIEEEEA